MATSYSPSTFDGVFEPDDYFLPKPPDFWSRSLLKEHTELCKTLCHVSRAWKAIAIPKLYERIHISKFHQLVALGRVLTKSCNEDRPSGYGGWIRQLSWDNNSVFCGQRATQVVDAMSLILKHTPNLHAFCPSPKMFATDIPTNVWDALLTNPTPLPLKVLHAMAASSLEDIVKLIQHSPNITTITLGLPWSKLEQRDLQLSHLRSLNVDCHSDQFSHIPEFAHSELPRLEQLKITFRNYALSPELLVPAHGRKLKFLHFKTFKALFDSETRPDIASFLDHCPNLTHLIVSWMWFQEGVRSIERNTKLIRLGLTGYSTLIRITPTNPPPLPAVRFPESLESVRILDIDPRMVRPRDLPHLRNHFREWQGRVQIDEDVGIF